MPVLVFALKVECERDVVIDRELVKHVVFLKDETDVCIAVTVEIGA